MATVDARLTRLETERAAAEALPQVLTVVFYASDGTVTQRLEVPLAVPLGRGQGRQP